MHRYDHLKEKAIELRRAKHSLDEIAAMLSINKTTVFYWIKDMKERPSPKFIVNTLAREKAIAATIDKYEKLRNEAYSKAFSSAAEDLKDLRLRDFICLYMGEGEKSSRNHVSFINSNPEMIKIAHHFISKMSSRKITYRLHLYPDHIKDDEISFWSSLLKIDPNQIKSRPKPGGNKMKRRNTRLKHGIFIVGTSDTYLMSKISAYMDFIKGQWK